MKFEVQLSDGSNKKLHVVELERNSETWRVSLDGQALEADAVQIDACTVSILLDGHSFVIQIVETPDGSLKLHTASREFQADVADPRGWRGRRHSSQEAQGRQQVLAPMPGKVVRILVNAGNKVEKGQALLVVEAMKMQNEIRSPKSGVVERLVAKEGQPVNAGEVLCVVF